MEEWPQICATVLAALYLRGLPRSSTVPRGEWPHLIKLMREEQPLLGLAATCLRRHGYWQHATCLEEPRLLSSAEQTVFSGNCLTPVDACYPKRWLTELGVGAPPALWMSGPGNTAPCASVVGSRSVSTEVFQFAFEAGKDVANAAMALFSGGAEGCDMAAERGALSAGGSAWRLMPCGLANRRGTENLTLLSLCAPWEEFSRENAMQRNGLIYAASQRTLVVQCRHREGGSWHGATDALRRRLGYLFVRRVAGDRGSAALEALGAAPVSNPSEFLTKPVAAFVEGSLFGIG